MRRRLAAGAVAIVAGMALMGGTASADPVNAKDSFVTDLVCDNGQTYTVVVNGNGDFTPAHDINSNATLVPVAFGDFTGTITDADGNVVDTFTEPGAGKGQSAKGGKNLVTCALSFTEVSDGTDPEFPAGFSFTGTGTVVVKITPSK